MFCLISGLSLRFTDNSEVAYFLLGHHVYSGIGAGKDFLQW